MKIINYLFVILWVGAMTWLLLNITEALSGIVH